MMIDLKNKLNLANTVQPPSPAVESKSTAAAEAGVPKPVIEGGALKISIAKVNVLDEMNRVDDVEEPSRDDPFGRFIADNLKVSDEDVPPVSEFFDRIGQMNFV